MRFAYFFGTFKRYKQPNNTVRQNLFSARKHSFFAVVLTVYDNILIITFSPTINNSWTDSCAGLPITWVVTQLAVSTSKTYYHYDVTIFTSNRHRYSQQKKTSMDINKSTISNNEKHGLVMGGSYSTARFQASISDAVGQYNKIGSNTFRATHILAE